MDYVPAHPLGAPAFRPVALLSICWGSPAGSFASGPLFPHFRLLISPAGSPYSPTGFCGAAALCPAGPQGSKSRHRWSWPSRPCRNLPKSFGICNLIIPNKTYRVCQGYIKPKWDCQVSDFDMYITWAAFAMKLVFAPLALLLTLAATIAQSTPE